MLSLPAFSAEATREQATTNYMTISTNKDKTMLHQIRCVGNGRDKAKAVFMVRNIQTAVP